MKIDNSSKYILGIVSIVAVVGIVVMLMSSGLDVLSSDGYDTTGQVASVSSSICKDTDGGKVYTTQGTVSGGLPTSRSSYTDTCTSSDSLTEYFCGTANKRKSQTVSCSSAVGSGYVCENGACVEGSGDSTYS